MAEDQPYKVVNIKSYEAEGQAGNVGAIITMVVGIGVAVLVLIFVGTLGGSTFYLVEDDLATIGMDRAVTESITVVNGTFTALSKAPIDTGLVVRNASGVVGIGNFTVDTTAGHVSLNTTNAGVINTINNSAVNVSYTYDNYTVQSSIRNGIASSFDGLEQTGNYLPVITLAIIITLVLGMILGLGMMKGRGNSGAL